MDNLQELRELVNPVVNTAKSCLDFDAKNGDPDEESRCLMWGERISALISRQ